MAKYSELFDEEELKDFKSLFPLVVKDIWDDGDIGKDIPQSLTRLTKSVEYNVPFHTKCRGFLIPYIFKVVAKSKPTESRLHLAKKIGWVVQIHTTLLVLTDDMYDDTDIRYGQLSWWAYTKRDVICINDTFLMEQVAFRLLEKYLKDEPILYAKIISCLNNLMYQYYLGESLEMELAKKLDKFSMEQYLAFQKYTVVNGPYCYLYFEIAFWLAENKDENLLKELREICEDLGYLWTIWDDFTDSYADKSEHGGVHDNDIRRGKITWLIVTAKEMCKKEQWEILKENYGKGNDESVEKVKGVYEELGVPELCRKHIKDKNDELMDKVQKIEKRGDPIAKPLLAMVIAYANFEE